MAHTTREIRSNPPHYLAENQPAARPQAAPIGQQSSISSLASRVEVKTKGFLSPVKDFFIWLFAKASSPFVWLYSKLFSAKQNTVAPPSSEEQKVKNFENLFYKDNLSIREAKNTAEILIGEITKKDVLFRLLKFCLEEKILSGPEVCSNLEKVDFSSYELEAFNFLVEINKRLAKAGPILITENDKKMLEKEFDRVFSSIKSVETAWSLFKLVCQSKQSLCRKASELVLRLIKPDELALHLAQLCEDDKNSFLVLFYFSFTFEKLSTDQIKFLASKLFSAEAIDEIRDEHFRYCGEKLFERDAPDEWACCKSQKNLLNYFHDHTSNKNKLLIEKFAIARLAYNNILEKQNNIDLSGNYLEGEILDQNELLKKNLSELRSSLILI